MSEKLFLITTPEYDDTTTYCSKWSEQVIENAESRGIRTINLNREKATRKNLEERIKSRPDFIMLNGHGDETTVTGHDNEPLLSCKMENEATTKNTVVYIRSCDSGAKLGPACIEKGCNAFIGYKANYAFLYDPSKAATPKTDETASYFFNVSNAIPEAILKGNTAKEALTKADVQLQKELDYLKTHYNPEAQNIIPWLIWNKTVRVTLGNKNAQI